MHLELEFVLTHPRAPQFNMAWRESMTGPLEKAIVEHYGKLLISVESARLVYL